MSEAINVLEEVVTLTKTFYHDNPTSEHPPLFFLVMPNGNVHVYGIAPDFMDNRENKSALVRVINEQIAATAATAVIFVSETYEMRVDADEGADLIGAIQRGEVKLSEFGIEKIQVAMQSRSGKSVYWSSPITTHEGVRSLGEWEHHELDAEDAMGTFVFSFGQEGVKA